MNQQQHDIILQIHFDCFQLCKKILDRYLPVAGNIAVFCQSEIEYENFLQMQKEVCLPSENPNQKYFRLKQDWIIPSDEFTPETTYTYLYIRKPSPDSPERGDIDFFLDFKEFQNLKKTLKKKALLGAKIYDRPGWDMIELRDSSINSLAYISYLKMAEKVRIRFD